MGLFSKNKNEGGLSDIIRCDEAEYLIWKWSPAGVPSYRENAIRWGSQLRVKQGELAVFVYKQNDGKQMDYFEGPLDATLRTANFPVLSHILGKAFGGASPFQAEVYFINLAGNIKLPFYIPPFDVADPRFLDYVVPVSVSGQILMNITDYKSFINLHRMIGFDLEDFFKEVKASVARYVKSAVTRAPKDGQIPLLQIGNYIDELSELTEGKLREALHADFGVNLKRLDLEDISLDKESKGYIDLYEVTTVQATEITKSRTEDIKERLRMGREVEFKRQNLGAETDYFAAHRLNRQADVAETAATSLGEMGGGFGGGGGDGLNPGAMMAGMMMGGAVGSGMAGMMGNMMQGVAQPQPPAPPAPPVPPAAPEAYYTAENGVQAGPFTRAMLAEMIAAGSLKRTTYLWKQGMAAWEPAGNLEELGPAFATVPPPPPVK